MSAKRLGILALAIAFVGGVPEDVSAQTKTIELENEILKSRNQSYDAKSDPFFLDFFFGKTVEEKVAEKRDDPFRAMTPEEQAIIDRWKTKQASRWESLPAEKFVINASAYTAAADECGKSDGVTASGLLVKKSRTLACPPEYPFGALIAIEGVGTLQCEDRGGAIKGNHFDIYMETKTEAFAFGRRNLVAEVVFE